MKYLLLYTLLLLSLKAEPMTANQLWSQLKSDPYTTLPHYTISFGKLFTWSKNFILSDAKRTLKSQEDLLPPYEKLAHTLMVSVYVESGVLTKTIHTVATLKRGVALSSLYVSPQQ